MINSGYFGGKWGQWGGRREAQDPFAERGGEGSKGCKGDKAGKHISTRGRTAEHSQRCHAYGWAIPNNVPLWPFAC